MTINQVDWEAVEEHYAQYSPEELAAMCQPKRCPACSDATQCKESLAASHAEFIQQSSLPE